jgi:hypothetical protein
MVHTQLAVAEELDHTTAAAIKQAMALAALL